MKRSLSVFALCVCAAGAQAEVYKWIDADGKTQYGDAPPKNSNAKVVSGGVTVVPAMIVPQASSAPRSNPEARGRDDGARAGGSGSIGPRSDSKPAALGASSEPAAAARAEARLKAIERCKSNRGVDCENEVDAQSNGQPVLTPMPSALPGVIPGWSQPPIHPNRPRADLPNSRAKRPPAQETEPVMPMKRLGAQSSSSDIKPVR